MKHLLQKEAKKFECPLPELRPGYTIRVHQKVQEGGKERIQIFEGIVIGVHKGHVPTDATVTVRKVVEGIGVEKIFPLCSPLITKMDVVKVAKVRRAKLFFLRGLHGKAARFTARFTTADEFTVEAPVEETAIEEKAEEKKEENPA